MSRARLGRDSKGFTLIEILGMSAVVLLILTVVLQLLVSVYRGTKRSAEEVSVQQTAALVVDRLTRDLKNSTSNQMLLTNELIAVRTLDSLTVEGRQVWSDELRIYRYEPVAKILYLSEYDLTENDVDKSGLTVTSETLLSEALPEKILARGVSSFQLQGGTTLQLRLVMESVSETRSLTIERAIHQPLKSR